MSRLQRTKNEVKRGWENVYKSLEEGNKCFLCNKTNLKPSEKVNLNNKNSAACICMECFKGIEESN